MLSGVGDDTAPADLAFSNFKLWLYQHHAIGRIVQTGIQRWKYQCERDERDIDRGNLESKRELIGTQFAGVQAFERNHTRVLAQTPDKLVVTHVDGPNLLRSVLQEAIGEPASGRANVDTSLVLRIDFEIAQGGFQLQTSAACVSKCLSLYSNLHRRIQQMPWLVDALVAGEHLTCKDQG